MTDQNTDTPKRLSDVELAKIRERDDRYGPHKGFIGETNYDRHALLSHIAALTAERGSVSEDRLGSPETYAYKYPDGFWRYDTGGREINGSKPIEQVGLYRFSAITQALTESSGQMGEEASAILRTLASVPDSADVSETDAKLSVGLLRRLLASGQGTDRACCEAMERALKDVIVGALLEYSGIGQGVDDMLFDVSSGQAEQIIAAMKKFGHLPLPVSADGRGKSYLEMTIAELQKERGTIDMLLQRKALGDPRVGMSFGPKQPSDTGGEK